MAAALAALGLAGAALLALSLCAQAQPAPPQAPAPLPPPAFPPLRCPDVATQDDVDLAAYAGRWYETAVTSRFKLQFERGLVCDRADYSPLPAAQASPNASSAAPSPVPGPAAIRVVNSGSFVSSVPYLGAIDAIASGNRNTCRSVYQIAQGASLCNGAANGGVLAGTTAVRRLVGNITVLALAFAQRTLNPLAMPNQTELGQNLSRQVQAQARQIISAAQAAQQRQTVAECSTALLNATVLAEQIIQFQQSVQQGFGTLVAASLANPPLGQGLPFSVTGNATQDRAHPGRLTVAFPFQAPSPEPNYLILLLTGDPALNYTGSLLYSCSEEEKGFPPRIEVYFLSRAKVLQPSIARQFESKLASLGILLDCDNVLVPSSQEGC